MHGETTLTQLFQESNAINFIFAAAILYFFLVKVLPESASKRKSELEQEIAKAQELKEEAEAKLTELEKEIDRAKAESTRIINSAKDNAEDIKNKTVAAAKAEIAKLNANATKEIEMQRIIAIESLRKEVAISVINETEKSLKSKQGEIDSLIKDKLKKDLAKV
ncbi:MAG: ATP synthase F0 subunit B [Cyanobacteria bacterium]|nr:ATP synthase F0 subunit B [Cyanobacteriota bacterium]MDA1021181.1 ATP synthase F0 subunit B [Cyanobacteriota bacterium]